MTKKLIFLLVILSVAFSAADAQTRRKSKKRKKPKVEAPAPEPVVETPAPEPPPDPMLMDTTTPPPPDFLSQQEEPKPEEPVVKPYERIVLEFDSGTNLITYSGVVEQPESSSDSLYIRAKKWSTQTFTGSGKAMYELDKKNQKLVINGSIPAFAYGNKYSKRPIGRFSFKMTVWFKEERYKYQISNLVHEGEKPNQGSAPRNYFEYYYTTTTNIRGCDQILRFADKDLNKMIDDFKKAMKEPRLVDEDEW